MAKSAAIRVIITVYGDGADFSKTLTGNNTTAGFEDMTAYAFASGFNNITAPSGAVGVVITNIAGGTLTVKGITGDTGRQLSSTIPNVLPAAASQGLTASGPGVTADITFF